MSVAIWLALHVLATQCWRVSTAVHCCDPVLLVVVMLVSRTVFNIVSALQSIVSENVLSQLYRISKTSVLREIKKYQLDSFPVTPLINSRSSIKCNFLRFFFNVMYSCVLVFPFPPEMVLYLACVFKTTSIQRPSLRKILVHEAHQYRNKVYSDFKLSLNLSCCAITSYPVSSLPLTSGLREQPTALTTSEQPVIFDLHTQQNYHNTMWP